MTAARSPDSVPIAVLATRLDAFDRVLQELKQLLTDNMQKMQALETREIGCNVLVSSKVDATHRRLDEHAQTLKGLDSRVLKIELLVPAITELLSIKQKLFIITTLGGFLGTAIGGMLIAWLFKMFTGTP